MKTAAKLIARFETEAERCWVELHAALAEGLPHTAARHRAKYERYMRAARWLRSR